MLLIKSSPFSFEFDNMEDVKHEAVPCACLGGGVYCAYCACCAMHRSPCGRLCPDRHHMPHLALLLGDLLQYPAKIVLGPISAPFPPAAAYRLFLSALTTAIAWPGYDL